MSKQCERCGALPARLEEGPFAGDYSLLDYCEYCSKDLCDKCFEVGTCGDSPNGKHRREGDVEQTQGSFNRTY